MEPILAELTTTYGMAAEELMRRNQDLVTIYRFSETPFKFSYTEHSGTAYSSRRILCIIGDDPEQEITGLALDLMNSLLNSGWESIL